ncbi:GNAT family N-acetyltransferase [Nonomuraea glycinis]|uniref:GNAT family N-acetyltransferase n=1 Tax=Nonomuraea glycinis TaxID=2047744 RepID=UPI002E166736|nr:GNAT family N-acetyltransferase [Nonomuraea glycinis]
MHTIERLPAEDFTGCVKGLAEVLADAVDDGASVGFLTPFDREAAAVWWRERAPAVADGSLIVWVCRDAGGIVATVSLALPGKPNSRHRAEVSKLLVHRDARGRGLARALLATAEAAAAEAGVSLLVLDTRTGSAAERLYLTGGWTLFGVVPGYAADPDGSLQDCSFFYKPIT